MRYMESSTIYFAPHTSDNNLRLHMANTHFNKEMSVEAPKKYSWGIAPEGTTNHHFEQAMCFITAEIIEEFINPIIAEKGNTPSE